MNPVLNTFPSRTGSDRIAIIGQSPGVDELHEGKPFVGPAGRLLNKLLQTAGISRPECFVGNICQHYPPNDKLHAWAWDDERIQSGLKTLRLDLHDFEPNICILLGNVPLKAALDTDPTKGWKIKTPKFKHPIGEWNAGLFISDLDPFKGRKCIGCYHPSGILRGAWANSFLALHALGRAHDEAFSPDLDLPKRRIATTPTPREVRTYLYQIEDECLTIAFDIEGGVNGIPCLSISHDPSMAMVVPLHTWVKEEVKGFWVHFKEVMANPQVGKVLQNALYDKFVLEYSFDCPVKNVVWDTMLSGWEIQPELSKGLMTLVQLYTREPPYKFTGDTGKKRKEKELTDEEWEEFRHYCGMDSALTLEVMQAHQKEWAVPFVSTHFLENLRLIEPLCHAMKRGILYNEAEARARRDSVAAECEVLQQELNEAIGRPINAKGPQLPNFFYDECGYRPYVNPKTKRPTFDDKSRLRLYKREKDERILLADKLIRKRDEISKYLNMSVDLDGRIRCSYNICGAETGRLSCSKSTTGSGGNLQTVPRQFRDLYCADPGHTMAEIDYSGADSWTVAAHLAALGDSTMLDDLRAGIKPAQVLALLRITGISDLGGASRAELVDRLQEVKQRPDWKTQYFIGKKASHATNYRQGPLTMSEVILAESWKGTGKAILVPVSECKALKELYLRRYSGLEKWWRWVQSQLARHPARLTTAAGHTRTFLGHPHEDGTLREAVAEEPQANTSIVTKRALIRCWEDPENRLPTGEPRVEILHSVHDCGLFQFRKESVDWAIPKMVEWFTNPLVIAGIDITIPFELQLGANWGSLKEVHV